MLESRIEIGVDLIEGHSIKNCAIFIVGEIREIIPPEEIIYKDGYVDIEKACSITISSVNSRYETKKNGAFKLRKTRYSS